MPFDLSRIPAARPALQPKLSIDRPGDRFESEADAVADKVMRMIEPVPPSPAPAAIERKCLPCSEEDAENGASKLPALAAGQGIMDRDEEMTLVEEPGVEEPDVEEPDVEEPVVVEPEETVQRKAGPGPAAGAPSSLVGERLTRAQASGEPLASAPRQRMETAFGRDFSQVRVHRDGEAAELSRQLAARAFTYGGHIYFGGGTYDPDGSSGRRLLAHELAHVVQQGHAGPVADGVMAAPPSIQRVATWAAATVHETNNLARQVLTGSDAGVSTPTFNGTRRGLLNNPRVRVRRAAGGGFNAVVSRVPANVVSVDETVLSAGPWNEVTSKAGFAILFGGPAQCVGPDACTFRAAGDPDDATVQAGTRRHEDHHVADGLAAFNAHVVPWDSKLTAAKLAGTTYHGATRRAAKAALFAAMGGTANRVRDAFSLAWNAAGPAYHATATGGLVHISGAPTVAADCSTASAPFKNPS